MATFWRFRCEQNHSWEVLDDEDLAEPNQDWIACPSCDGDAVTAACQPAADRVSVTLLPAARVVDEVKGQVGDDSMYYLQISPRDGSRSVRSAVAHEWGEAVAKAGLLRGRSWTEALARWDRLGLGKMSR
jgi:hypothetical protein